jgi:dolichol kinase
LTRGSVTLDFDELVGRTSGAQPWRKLFHATNGVAVAAALTHLPLSSSMVVLVLTVVLVVLGLVDLVRLRVPTANRLFFRAFARLASPREARGVASSTWYALGLLLAVTLFPSHHAVSGVLVLALADPVASYVGQRWGRKPFLGGTVEGTIAFFSVAVGVLALRNSVFVALAAAAVVAIAERRSWPLDDNLTIPVTCAGVLTALGFVT